MIAAGYIVTGIVCGTFVVLGSRTVNGVEGVQVKEVNPNNHNEMSPGELWLPLEAVKPLA